jgi:uncharacterized membrane protein
MPAVPIRRRKLVGLIVVFFWVLIGGIAHFAATETEMRIVPPYVPWPRAAVLVSGVFELLGAAGLLWRPTRRAAAIGLFLLTLAVTPCHIYMLQSPALFSSVPLWALWLRLPLQVALLALTAWCAAVDRRVAGGLSHYRPIWLPAHCGARAVEPSRGPHQAR